ncbi:MAG: hypothetical protein ACHQSE_12870, partial [Gemmatimonadales bacterium]
LATVLGAIFIPAAWAVSRRPMPLPFLLMIPLGAAIGFAAGRAIGVLMVEGSGRTAQAFTLPATAGFRASEHSEIDTLEARGKYAEAAAAWEAVAIAHPDDPWPLVRSAELHARELADPALAVERFRLARSLPGAKPELQRYASQKIIDLLLGPLADKGRAMVELRMLADKHPASREAEGAREALRNLKGDNT